MSADDRSPLYQRWLRHTELTLSVLLLATIGVLGVSNSATIDEMGLLVVFAVPGLLSVTALVSTGCDVYQLTLNGASLQTSSSRWLVIGTLCLTGITGLLGIGTLSIVVQTILVVTVIDTGGGVILGPLLWMLTGTALAVVICLRSAVETFLMDQKLIVPGRSSH